VRENFEQRHKRRNPLVFAGWRTWSGKRKDQDLPLEQSLACARAERKENLQEKQSRETLATVQKKELIALVVVGARENQER
jgi:hypothetical protein